MYFKEQRFEKAKASTFASTHVVELPDTGLLDSISLNFRATNPADPTGNAPNNLHHHITKIEVIGNTDKILFSLTGECALAKAYRKIGALPPFTQNEYGLKSQSLLIPIFFGRHFKDGQYALDLSKWDKVELKVTNDAVTTNFAAASLNMETRLCTIEDSTQTYSKFLKQWEYQADKPDADADYVRPKLPTTGLLRSLMIQLDPDLTATTSAVAQDPVSDSYNWKLWFKDRALTIRDHRPKDLMRDEHLKLGLGHSVCKPFPSTTRYTDFHWAYIEAIAMSHIKENGADVTVCSLEDNNNRYQKVAFAGTGTFYQAAIQGIGLFHTFEIPWFTTDMEQEYLNLDQYKPIEIEWYGHKQNNTHRIILEKPIGQGSNEFA
jgi:hypothetical protein